MYIHTHTHTFVLSHARLVTIKHVMFYRNDTWIIKIIIIKRLHKPSPTTHHMAGESLNGVHGGRGQKLLGLIMHEAKTTVL